MSPHRPTAHRHQPRPLALALALLLSLGLAACGSESAGPASAPDASAAPDGASAYPADAALEPADAGLPAEDAGQDSGTLADHTLVLGGKAHRTGDSAPLENCTACHGATLQGGTGPSCYACHDTSSHTRSYRGILHESGAASSCTVCHGPSNSSTGGLGPACRVCH